MFYVIEGFLDVILPVTDLQRQGGSDAKLPPQENNLSGRTSKQSTLDQEGREEGNISPPRNPAVLPVIYVRVFAGSCLAL